MKTRCLIVDDEPLAVRVVANLLARVPDVEVVGTCTNALEAFDFLRSERVDLLFLDIEMPELSGLELLRSLDAPPRVVFTTAYREYAVEGFDLDVVDYLLKPVSLPRLLRALARYHRYRTGDEAGGASDAAERPVLLVREDARVFRLPLKEIQYIEAWGDYVRIHAAEVHLSKERLHEIEERLNPHGFVRIHRSYVVNVRHVRSYTRDEARVGEERLPIGRTYQRQATEALEAAEE